MMTSCLNLSSCACADRPTEVRLGIFVMSFSYFSEQTMVRIRPVVFIRVHLFSKQLCRRWTEGTKRTLVAADDGPGQFEYMQRGARHTDRQTPDRGFTLIAVNATRDKRRNQVYENVARTVCG